ncbi:MAG: hypothetical protein CO186_04080 [Zetaproteobacteria bacterium CG_4_9_14_3_um_filter_49_83]|nr:MAG: hypothetical protein AUJ56_09780 [Zetaproteobacteria bacterium CG1_02_49_23]PIQ30557.1 MAG: hypothetical protein COW62_12020 [Zetaproteobacteria bacterium CG17_big_fil_post_rev_8_21_14_2_50_50_13]PIV31320.1 MAG: hypothetical protein COS35_01985 [Zetaproteobacteria bacterium CG02_land_8_20_14_3_00_50_9]PIY55129.1 MAG: hypothetical protein COZ00_11065 [Zetaproteobacteria bacterium CG_4_10_14_0_8_um_filter_49_80]PJA35788.1 MAG: hypothetical protein CO186_04080 [Zetaproteobacteria bacterium
MNKAIKRIAYTQVNHRIIASVITVIFVAGCASTPATPVSTEQMALSKAALSSAISAGANEYAPLQIKSSMEKIDGAEQAMQKKNYVLARQLAEEAQVDAKLAEATARAVKAQQATDEVQEGNRVLRQEINRNSN